MIPTIKNFTPPPDAAPYNPAKTITVPAGGTADMELQGRGSDVFGITRMLPYCSDFNAIEVRAELNNERIIFSDIQLSVLRQLFRSGQLLAPYIIQQNNDLGFTFTNTSGSDIDVNMQLLGYDGPSLRKLIRLYEKQAVAMPKPVFLYAKAEIPSFATKQPVDIPSKSVDVELHRAAVRTDSDPDMSVSLETYNETIKNGVFVQQLNDEFSNGRRALVPIEIGKNVPFSLKATNRNADPQTLSFLGEAYVIDN